MTVLELIPPSVCFSGVEVRQSQLFVAQNFLGGVSSAMIGKPPTRKEILSVDELVNYGGWDLGIL